MTCLFSPAERCAVHGSVTETAPLFPGDNLDNKLLPHQRLQKGQDLQAFQGDGTDPIHSQEPSDRGLTGPCRACSSNSLEQTAGRSSACQCSIAFLSLLFPCSRATAQAPSDLPGSAHGRTEPPLSSVLHCRLGHAES